MTSANNGILDGLRRISGKFRDLTVDGGLPGAPFGFRLRGATVSGAPKTGTWKLADMVAARNGVMWMCTAAGPPGSWVPVGTTAPVTSVAANYTATASDFLIIATATLTVTLPVTGIPVGKRYIVKNGSANTVVVAPASGTIDGAANITDFNLYDVGEYLFDGTNYQLVSGSRFGGWLISETGIYGPIVEGASNTLDDGSGNATIAGLASLNGGTDSSGTAAASTPTLSTGTAAQISTTQDVMLYCNIKTTSTFSLAIGPTSTPATTVVTSASFTAPHLIGAVRIPKGWYVKSTFTSADVTWTAVTC